MPLISKDDAQLALAPLHSAFYDAIDSAWVKWKADLGPHFARPRRALAVCMNEVAEQELRMRLGSVPNVQLSDPRRNRFWIEVGSPDLLVFVKKFVDGFQIRNYATDTAERFNGQGDLPDFPNVARVTLGYFVTTTHDKLVGTHIALLKNNQLQWSYELRRDPSNGGALVVPDQPSLPMAPAALKLKLGPAKKANE